MEVMMLFKVGEKEYGTYGMNVSEGGAIPDVGDEQVNVSP
jgi:hypothetical protein